MGAPHLAPEQLIFPSGIDGQRSQSRAAPQKWSGTIAETSKTRPKGLLVPDRERGVNNFTL